MDCDRSDHPIDGDLLLQLAALLAEVAEHQQQQHREQHQENSQSDQNPHPQQQQNEQNEQNHQQQQQQNEQNHQQNQQQQQQTRVPRCREPCPFPGCEKDGSERHQATHTLNCRVVGCPNDNPVFTTVHQLGLHLVAEHNAGAMDACNWPGCTSYGATRHDTHMLHLRLHNHRLPTVANVPNANTVAVQNDDEEDEEQEEEENTNE
ncbi:hypothetical protein G7054_g2992 [Neopestalotiopsis clavispora]|nr:hypothetical protein G7054_g2992 [Neopestalotiopsis clavispora]